MYMRTLVFKRSYIIKNMFCRDSGVWTGVGINSQRRRISVNMRRNYLHEKPNHSFTTMTHHRLDFIILIHNEIHNKQLVIINEKTSPLVVSYFFHLKLSKSFEKHARPIFC